ncbi:hypothetical protein OIU78_030130 [Salix suchowensis]|nr:hypothetical protein OIU78_030130 [Salix suchowensis]
MNLPADIEKLWLRVLKEAVVKQKQGFRLATQIEKSKKLKQWIPSSLNSAELERFLNQEKERAMVNEMVAKLTSACWDKCITSSPGSKFSSSESSCLTNCAQRYMDMSLIIMKRFQSMN